MQKKYRIRYTYSSRDDIREMKKYILESFKYRELGENFTKKIKAAVDDLRTLPTGHNTTGIRYKVSIRTDYLTRESILLEGL